MARQQIEVLQALFLEQGFAEKTLKIQGERVYRVQIGGLRHYRRGNSKIYKSLTTFLSQVLPENKFLTDWKMKMAAELGGKSEMEGYVEKTAGYGSALHIAGADFVREAGVVWSDFEYKALQMLQAAEIPPETLEYALPELTRDFAALLQFFYDYNVEVLAVELPAWTRHGVATLLDFVVEMDAKFYQKTPEDKRKRHRAIINIKSGKKGFFEPHVFQLVGERLMFNETYGKALGYEIEEVYNWAPNAWNDAPSYKIKNQTATISAGKMDRQFQLYLDLGKLRGVLTEPSKLFAVFTGRTAVGENPTAALQMLGYDKFSKLKIKKHNADQKAV